MYWKLAFACEAKSRLSPDANYRSFDMSPDGKRLLMMFPADQSDSGEPARPQINIVLNWFEELKERVPVP